MVGNRQSQWLSNPPVCELRSELTQLPTPVAPPFSILRKLVNAVPSAGYGLRELCHVYLSFTQWIPGQVLSFFSH